MFTWPLGDGIELRLLLLQDAPLIFEAVDRNRDHLRPWFTWVDETRSPEDSRAYIQRCYREMAEGREFTAAIWVENTFAGLIDIHNIHAENRVGEVGYWLDKAFTGRGVMTRACRAIVDFGFERLHLNRIEVHCAVENRRSCAIPERLGFTRESVRRQSVWLYDRFVDMAVYVMLAETWRKKKLHEEVPDV